MRKRKKEGEDKHKDKQRKTLKGTKERRGEAGEENVGG